MTISSRFAVAVHILTLLETGRGEPLTSGYIAGSVNTPGEYPYEPGMRVSDLLRAGGLLNESAYPLQAELTRYAVERQHRGDAVRAIAQAVGLSPESIRRWTMASPTRRRRALVPVVVHDHDEDRAGISVVAPSGYRVEGLTVASAAALLRELV